MTRRGALTELSHADLGYCDRTDPLRPLTRPLLLVVVRVQLTDVLSRTGV